MRVWLVITNIDGFHEVPYSFGLSSIAAYIQSKGHETEILAIHDERGCGKFGNDIALFRPDVIGFSAVSSQFKYVKKLSELSKRIDRNIKVVCGGVHPTLYPNALLETDAIDGFFVGESEIAFAEYLDELEGNREYADTQNYVFRKDGRVIENSLNPLISDLEKMPFPVKDQLFEEFIRTSGHAPFFFSRGCPYSCTYCSNHALAGKYGMRSNKPRYRSVESCIREIKEARASYRFGSLWIMDDTFGLSKQWRKEFCERYEDEIKIRYICNLRANVLDEQFVKLLKKSGCYRILFGIESGNEYIRNQVMKRNISTEQIIHAFDLCHKNGIETYALNIIGVPGETESMIQDTIRLNRRINPKESAVNIFYPYKGTVLGDRCFAENLVDEGLYNDFSNERRDTVLKFPQDHKEKLRYYQLNWSVLIHPFRLKNRIRKILRTHRRLYNFIRKIRCLITSRS